jgi:MFS family permease
MCLHLLGNFTAAQATEYWQLLLSQGLCIGLGNGMVSVPTLAIMSTYFQKRRALAFALAATGSATGGIIFPAIVRNLLPQVGFAWTMRCIAFVQMVGFAFAAVFARSRIPPRKAGPMIDWAGFRDLPYILYSIGAFFVSLRLGG